MHQDEIIAFNDRMYDHAWVSLQQLLKPLHERAGLVACLRALLALSVDRGFIQDDLEDVVHFTVVAQAPPRLPFAAQFNPRRALRHRGAGRHRPPPGRTSVHDNAFLARDNVKWQQCGLELAYELEVCNRAFHVWPNPFPFHPTHMIAATRAPELQHWRQPCSVDQIIEELCTLALALPGFIVLFNGPGAGASIPTWFHYHLFERWPDHRLCLEDAVRRQDAGDRHWLVEGYPVPVVAIRCQDAQRTEHAIQLVSQWTGSYGRAATMNLIATRGESPGDGVTLLFCPRDRTRCRVPGFSGHVGGLEILGEIVLSSSEDKARLDRGEIDADLVNMILASVQAESFPEFYHAFRAQVA